MTGLTFVLPMPENLTNRGSGKSHWRTIHREKLEYWDALDCYQAFGAKHPRYHIPAPPLRPFAKATIRSVMYLGGEMDEENAVARHKVAIDWLKTRGYIADDRRKNLKWEGFPEQIVKRDGNYRIVLTLTPIK